MSCPNETTHQHESEENALWETVFEHLIITSVYLIINLHVQYSITKYIIIDWAIIYYELLSPN